jgi:signal transduction histidine kinase
LKKQFNNLRLHRKSLAVQSWFYLTGFSVFILLILWLLQFAFFKPFYESMRLQEIRRTGREIVREYEESSGSMGELWKSAFRQNLRILLLDGASNIVVNFDGFGTLFDDAGGKGRVDEPELLLRFAASGEAESAFIVAGKGSESGRAVYIARVQPSTSGERYIYVASPIPAQDSTVRVLAAQFLIITVILLLLSALLAVLLSRRIAHPILALKDAATGLARGQFRAVPSKRAYSEITELSSELERATEELAKAERYQKELVANVSHDLKTPLTIIRFYGELLRDVSGADPAKRTAHCEKIIEEADRLSGMVNEMLELSKLEQQAMDADDQPLNLSALLCETAGRFTALCEKEGYRFECAIAPELWVSGQEALLARALYNLIANAVNYTGEDKRVLLRLFPLAGSDDGATRVRVEISDTGEGIPQEELEQIWARYYKSSQPHRRGVVGAGLGLSIVQSALEYHGAVYGVTSALGQGSTFWFEMPMLH